MKDIKKIIAEQNLCVANTADFHINALENGRLELVVSVEGNWLTREMEVTAQRHQEMLKNFTDEGKDLLFDFDHDCLGWGSSKAAAWGKAMRIEGNKLIVEVETTKAGKDALDNKEFKYLSPVYQYRWQNRHTGEIYNTWRLHSVAFTNVPFIQELPAMTNNENNSQGEPMKDLLKALGAEDEASAIAAVNELKANALKLEADNSVLHAKINAQEVDAAIAANKLVPAQKELATKLINSDRALYDEFIKNNAPIANVTQDVKVPQGTDANANSEPTSYSQLLNDPVLEARINKENPELYEKLHTRWMKEGK